jgi:hypothetical protein
MVLSFASAWTETAAGSIAIAAAKTANLSVRVFVKWFNMFLPSLSESDLDCGERSRRGSQPSGRGWMNFLFASSA